MAPERAQYNKGDLSILLKALAGELADKRETMELFIYGGAAMVLGPDGLREFTGDIDAFSSTHRMSSLMDIRRSVATTVAKKDGQPANFRWLTVSSNQSGTDIGAMVKDKDTYFDAAPDLSGPHLKIYIMKDEAQLAMKLLRDTPEGAKPQDILDVAALTKKLCIENSPTGLMKVWNRHKGVLGQTPAKVAKVEANIRNPKYWAPQGQKI